MKSKVKSSFWHFSCSRENERERDGGGRAENTMKLNMKLIVDVFFLSTIAFSGH